MNATYNPSWLLLSALIFFLMNPIGIAITYHRYWAHRSFEFKSTFMKYFCSFWAMASGVGSILGWVGIHNDHHAYADTDKDPHMAAKGFWPMISMSAYDYKPHPKKVAYMLRDKFITYTHKFYFAIPLMYAGICFILGGLTGLVFGYMLPAAMSLITQNTTNYVNHLREEGYTPSNVAWINVFNFGDGWHENHHNDPTKYTTKVEPHQHDPAGWVIENVLMAR